MAGPGRLQLYVDLQTRLLITCLCPALEINLGDFSANPLMSVGLVAQMRLFRLILRFDEAEFCERNMNVSLTRQSLFRDRQAENYTRDREMNIIFLDKVVAHLSWLSHAKWPTWNKSQIPISAV